MNVAAIIMGEMLPNEISKLLTNFQKIKLGCEPINRVFFRSMVSLWDLFQEYKGNVCI